MEQFPFSCAALSLLCHYCHSTLLGIHCCHCCCHSPLLGIHCCHCCCHSPRTAGDPLLPLLLSLPLLLLLSLTTARSRCHCCNCCCYSTQRCHCSHCCCHSPRRARGATVATAAVIHSPRHYSFQYSCGCVRLFVCHDATSE